MTKLDDLKNNWIKDPEFKAEYEALEVEFSSEAARILARSEAASTQDQVAVKRPLPRK